MSMSEDGQEAAGVCYRCLRPGGRPGFCSLACRTAALADRRELLRRVRDGLTDGAGDGAPHDRDAEQELVELTRAEVDFAVGMIDGGTVAAAAPRMPPGMPALEGLTPSQWTVLLLVGDGFTNREVAHLLSVSSHTVRNYLSAVLARTGLRNRTEIGALVGSIRTMIELAPAAVPCLEPLLDAPRPPLAARC